jgi:hypothetical protein
MHDIPATGVGWIANLYFTLFTLSMYGLVVQKLAVSAGGNFIRLVMGGSGVKIVGSVLILTLVHVFFHPLNRSEVVLFLIIYALFTIFETYVLMKLSNQKL